jgi:hypothetical protein
MSALLVLEGVCPLTTLRLRPPLLLPKEIGVPPRAELPFSFEFLDDVEVRRCALEEVAAEVSSSAEL